MPNLTASLNEQRNARLYFVNGVLQHMFGFTGEAATGAPTASAPREIMPHAGDRFNILEKWLELDSSGSVIDVVHQASAALTFRDQIFTWDVLDAAAGQYVGGFIIEDLDGNAQVIFQPITVR